jgi:branched-chain amino acid transport system substrate-binding protein
VGGAGTPAEVNPSLPLTFVSWSGQQTIPTVYDYLVETYPTVRTVAISYQEDPSCGYIVEVVQQVAEERGLQVVFFEPYPFDTVDFYPLLTKMLATNPDAIDLGCTAPPSAVAIFNQARELGFRGPIVYTGQGIADLIVAMVGKDMATDFIGTDPDFTSPELPSITKEIKEYMMDNYGKELNNDICLGWGVLWYVTQAIEAAQSLEPAEVAAVWEKMESIESAFGAAKMGGLVTYGINHVVCQPRVILRIQNGEMETIEWLVPEIP